MIEILIWIFACFFSTLGCSILYYKFSNAERLFSKKFCVVFVFGIIIQTAINYYHLNSLRFFSFFFYFPFLFYIINPLNRKSLTFHVFTVWIFGILFDLMCMLIITILRFYYEFNTYGFYFEGCVTLVTFLLFLFCAYNSRIKNFVLKIFSKLYELTLTKVFFFAFSVFLVLVGLVIFVNLKSLSINFLLYILLILALFSFVILTIFLMNERETTEFLRILKENNNFYIKMDDENRIFRHNLMAKLISIKSVSNKKGIALIDDYILKFDRNGKYAKRISSIPYGLNGIIYQKTCSYLDSINFKITNRIDVDIFSVLKPRRYNVLVEKLIVCLDNALEASLNSKSKIVVIHLFEDEDKICIEIKNSFSRDVDVDLLGKKSYSTKGNKRGIGLFSILRNSEVSMNVKIVNNYFICCLYAKKQKK